MKHAKNRFVYLLLSIMCFAISILMCSACLVGCKNEEVVYLPNHILSKPENGVTNYQPFPCGLGGSTYFRIPALNILNDGTLVAACDARWGWTLDSYGFDTVFSYSKDNGRTWQYSFVNYFGDNGNTINETSTSFIDSSLTTDGDILYLLCDLFPCGGMSENCECGTGFNASGYLLLDDNYDGENFDGDYYLKNHKIYNNKNEEIIGLYVDEYYNIFGEYSGITYNTNIFFSDSPFKVMRTSYLYLIKSCDGGNSWSHPLILNPMIKKETEGFCGVSPGHGIVLRSGRIIFTCYGFSSYNNYSESRAFCIFSDDNGVTWQRGNACPDFSGESSVFEVDRNGESYLYMFARETSSGSFYISNDGGATWSVGGSSSIDYNEHCNFSIIATNSLDNGSYILLSAPANRERRDTGKIFIGSVETDGNVNFNSEYLINGKQFFGYSSLVKMNNGDIAILFETSDGIMTFRIITKEMISNCINNYE